MLVVGMFKHQASDALHASSTAANSWWRQGCLFHHIRSSVWEFRYFFPVSCQRFTFLEIFFRVCTTVLRLPLGGNDYTTPVNQTCNFLCVFLVSFLCAVVTTPKEDLPSLSEEVLLQGLRLGLLSYWYCLKVIFPLQNLNQLFTGYLPCHILYQKTEVQTAICSLHKASLVLGIFTHPGVH